MRLLELVENSARVYPRIHNMGMRAVSNKVIGKFMGSYIHDNYNIKIWRTGTHHNRYITQIGFKDPTLGKNSDVMVHCTCPYFMFYLEVVLAHRRASFLYNAISEWPRIKNPSGKAYLCKHLVKVAAPTLDILNKENMTSEMTQLLVNPYVPKF